jgi:superfamily II DNA/RNA helicase
LDHFERGGLLLRGVDVLVIDEADRMLDMGFIPDVERIVQLCNPKRQTLFFSATMPPEIRRLADVFLNDPTEIAVAPPASPAETVDQTLTMVQPRDKDRVLQSLLRSQPVKNALIFCNRKRDVDAVSKTLKSRGFDALALHGDMQQSYRMQTLEKFRNNEVKILVCSDVAARGLDIQGLSHVFLYDVPIHAEDYVHRIGRTGRAGMPGRALTLATSEDRKFLAAVEKLVGKAIPRFDPDGQAAPGPGDDNGGGSRSEAPPKVEVAKNTEPGPEAVADSAPDVMPESTPEAAFEAPAEPADKPAPQEQDKPRREGRQSSRGRGRGGRSRSNKNETTAAPGETGKAGSKAGEKNAGRSRGRGGRKQGESGRDGNRGGSDRSVVGLGDHMPAFLARGSTRKKGTDK